MPVAGVAVKPLGGDVRRTVADSGSVCVIARISADPQPGSG